MPYKVAIIGSGVSGLTAVKCCLEEGLEPLCFERHDYIGGLWHFTEEIGNGNAAVMRSTVTNTSKEMTTFSDFPPPKEFPPYTNHWLFDKYLNLYADKFDLRRYIQLKTEVVSVDEAVDHSVSGRWVINAKQVDTGKVESLLVNAVMVCVGSLSKPHMPPFEGLQEFQGSVIHSNEYRDSTGYEGKNVIVVGFGNTAADIATDVSRVAKQVYMSTRRGVWLLNRTTKYGLPIDMTDSRFAGFIHSHFPSYVDGVLEREFSEKLDHERYGLHPSARPTQTDNIENDYMLPCLINGSIKITKGVSKLTGNTVEFTDGSYVDDVDVVIMATGYRTSFPFLDKQIFGEDVTNLYKATFLPDRKHATFAVVGCYRVLGPFPPAAEMQCRVATRVFKGLVQLPSKEEMVKDVERRRQHSAIGRGANKPFLLHLVWIPFMNELAPMIGVNPNIFWLLLTDWRLALQCVFGTCTPYQFRLRGPGAWKGAREALLTQMDRTFYSLDHGANRLTKKKNGVLGRVIMWSFTVLVIINLTKFPVPLRFR